jgi:hypothetical protein
VNVEVERCGESSYDLFLTIITQYNREFKHK